jgi:hypothetical protein
MTFTKGAMAVVAASPKPEFLSSLFNDLDRPFGPKARRRGRAVAYRYIGQVQPD